MFEKEAKFIKELELEQTPIQVGTKEFISEVEK